MQCGYNTTRGLWVVSVDMDTSMTSEELGGSITFGLEVHDTLGYATSTGTKQEQPDANTAKFTRGMMARLSANANIVVSQDVDTGTVQVPLRGSITALMRTHRELDDVNDPVVTMDGSTVVSLDVNLTTQVLDTTGTHLVPFTLSGSFDLSGASSNVLVPKPSEGSDTFCPTGGEMAVEMAIDLKVRMGSEHYTAKNNWQIDLGFQGDGTANVSVQSGDYHETTNSVVCSEVK